MANKSWKTQDYKHYNIYNDIYNYKNLGIYVQE